MAHLASILFFTGLLVALALLLELTVRAHWAEIAAALRGVPSPAPRPLVRPAAAPAPAVIQPQRAAA